MKRLTPRLVVVILLFLLSYFFPRLADDSFVLSDFSEEAIIDKVIDGDTVRLSTGQTLRYIGIDTPETVDPRRPVGCFGREASRANSGLVLGKTVRLEKDTSDTDKYGRLLRYVWVGEIFVNEYLVKNGFAKSSSYPPDIKYQDTLRAAESFARQNKLGLWGAGCEADLPDLP